MNYNEFYECCEQIFSLNKYLPTLEKENVEKLFILTNRMLEVNKSMNLTAIKDEKAIILRHYADSLAISEYLTIGANIIDVGCGAGFPTLPLAIFRPDLKITALDSTAKRIQYVKDTAKLVGLENVDAISDRAENLANDIMYREKFDHATARAVAALPILSEICLPFVKVGGTFVAMKAQKAEEEISNSTNAIIKCGGNLDQIISRPLTDYDNIEEKRNIVIISKRSRTPKEFPRHFSKISKKPL